VSTALDDFVQGQIEALSCGNWLTNCECGRCADRREMQLEHDARQITLRERIELLRPYLQHADCCGDQDSYNGVDEAERSCGCGLDILLAHLDAGTA
jgi:hypothetical protein